MESLHLIPNPNVFLLVTLSIVHYILPPCQSQNVQFDSLYHARPLQGTTLTLNRTKQEVSLSMKCAMECTKNWVTSRACLAFAHDTVTRKCDFYSVGDTVNDASAIRVHLRQVRERFHDITIDGKRFSIYLSNNALVFVDARTFCHSVGGYLLEYDWLEENQAVQLVVASEAGLVAWVGANDLSVAGQFVTDRGGHPLDTTVWLWAPLEPDLPEERCVVYWFLYSKLADYNCHWVAPSLCERDVL